MDNKAKDLISRYDKLAVLRAAHADRWEELSIYLSPGQQSFNSSDKGQVKTAVLEESTGLSCAQTLASSMHGSLTSSSTKWYDLRFRSEELNKDAAAKEWLEECTKRLYQEFNKSNFGTEVAQLYLDLVVFGTGAQQFDIETKDGQFDGFNFKSCHLSEIVIAQSSKGVVDTVLRKIKLTARQAEQMFGDKCGEKVLKALVKDPDQTFEFIHAVEPRKVKKEPGLLVAEKLRPFAGFYVSVEDVTTCKETGYYESPFRVPRWGKASGDVYGFGPGDVARPDVRTLNEARNLSLSALSKSMNLPVVANMSGITNGIIDLRAGGVTHATQPNAVVPIPMDANWGAHQLETESIRAAVRKIFFADQLELSNGPQMTATESQIRYELMQRLMGPTLGRLKYEFLDPTVERGFFAMLRGGAFPEMPESVAERGDDLDIEYVGPLARAQKMEEVTAIQRLTDITMSLAELKPEVLDMFNVDEAFKIVSDRLGSPVTVKSSEDEVKKVRDDRQDQQKKREEMEQEMQKLQAAAGVQQIEAGMNE